MFHCKTCGEPHDEVPLCFGPRAPEAWLAIPRDEQESRGELGTDQCVIDESDCYILGCIEIPITDKPDTFVWLAWVSLSFDDLLRASELWETEGREKEPPYDVILASTLPYASPTLGLKAQLITQPVGERPLIRILETDHPLAIEQSSGITMHRIHQMVKEIMRPD